MFAEKATTVHADTEISYQLDAQWQVVHASDGLCRLLHRTPTVLIGRKVHDLVPREARASFFRQTGRALAGIGACDTRMPRRVELGPGTAAAPAPGVALPSDPDAPGVGRRPRVTRYTLDLRYIHGRTARPRR